MARMRDVMLVDQTEEIRQKARLSVCGMALRFDLVEEVNDVLDALGLLEEDDERSSRIRSGSTANKKSG